jgi:cytochrome P450
MKQRMNESMRCNLPSPLVPRAAYFDDSLEAWVLSRYADVAAAFHCPRLLPSGSSNRPRSRPPVEHAEAQMRKEVRDALSPSRLRGWSRKLGVEARVQADGLSTEAPVDLLASYAKPVCLKLAAMVTGISLIEAERLRALAEPVLAAAAEPYDRSLKESANSATAKIRNSFYSGPESLRDSGFVALAHTVPCLLGNAWYALIRSRQQWTSLHEGTESVEQAVEELLRCSGVPRILFRQAVDNVQLNGLDIHKGQRVVLQVEAANRDPEKFVLPNRLDVQRRGGRHLSLGAGPHSCAGAGLIRMAATTLTQALVERFSRAKLSQPVAWRGGSGFRFPASLPVELQRPTSA